MISQFGRLSITDHSATAATSIPVAEGSLKGRQVDPVVSRLGNKVKEVADLTGLNYDVMLHIADYCAPFIGAAVKGVHFPSEAGNKAFALLARLETASDTLDLSRLENLQLGDLKLIREHFPKAKKLDLSCCSGLTAEWFDTIAQFSELEELTLNDLDVKAAVALQAIDKLKMLHNLHTLSINNYPYPSDLSGRWFSGILTSTPILRLLELKHLRKLSLRCDTIPLRMANVARVLARSLPKLEHLDMSNSKKLPAISSVMYPDRGERDSWSGYDWCPNEADDNDEQRSEPATLRVILLPYIEWEDSSEHYYQRCCLEIQTIMRHRARWANVEVSAPKPAE